MFFIRNCGRQTALQKDCHDLWTQQPPHFWSPAKSSWNKLVWLVFQYTCIVVVEFEWNLNQHSSDFCIFTATRYDAEKEEHYQQEAKQKELQRIEETLQMASRKGKANWPPSDPYMTPIGPPSDPCLTWPLLDPIWSDLTSIWPLSYLTPVWPLLDPHLTRPLSDPYLTWPLFDPY